jgi:hypothetical protein
MFGFRPGRGTADPLLVLKHMIDMNRADVGMKFGVAVMDMSAAYDSIDRNLLFTNLKHEAWAWAWAWAWACQTTPSTP